MNTLDVFLILLCMFAIYKWKQEEMRSEHLQDILDDKVGLIQTYKHLLACDKKKSTRIQNELNRIDNLYQKLKKETK